jgi:hypothetical protein
MREPSGEDLFYVEQIAPYPPRERPRTRAAKPSNFYPNASCASPVALGSSFCLKGPAVGLEVGRYQAVVLSSEPLRFLRVPLRGGR